MGSWRPPANAGLAQPTNQEFPTYAIDGDSIRQSVQSRIRARQRNETGVALNPRLNDMLRENENRSVFGP